jgi:hypothetical protein
MKVLKSIFRILMKELYLRKKDQAIFMRSSQKHHNQQSIFSDFSIIILINYNINYNKSLKEATLKIMSLIIKSN